MAKQIKKLKFKQNASLQIEVVPLHTLITVNKEHLLTPHRTNFYHIFLFENCQPTHFVDFEPISIEPYSFLFIDKDRVHQFDQLLKYEGRVLIFTDDFYCITDNDTRFLRSSILFNDFAGSPTIVLNKASFEKYTNICQSITEELGLPDDDSKHTLLKNLLQNFLLLAEREKRKQGFLELKKGADLDYTLLFRDLLENKYTKLKSVNDYSKIICISEKRLGQATSKILGKSPKEIINDRILLEAKRLLVHSNLSVKEIGQELGFEDPAYFVRYFKKNTEATPVEFKESHLKK
ncbi:AraC family transcriptional regulator [Flavipsychrobacter stenotrophus]|uniref:AraC family transcriptional regulator n=1 Tax=Flavipsychrobacter stenotrophus TaxID=2077091 RepID=A0A2S7SQ02_9BACT|nr:helix-turn-helix domain-containing protein [Flavipsychrobacter stenotrophus]PQJ08970.1 AraC family transcriptional regulator [Flavipsychrobacter stenotrophus]